MEKPVIVTEKGLYHLYDYQSEVELERMIVEHASEIFGKNSRYFAKKKIDSKSGFGTIPDGYVIDFDKKKLYIIEIELIRHDLRKHILPQIASFIMALQNKSSQEKLIKIFEEELASSYKITREELKTIVTNYGIIILIDEVGDPMKEINPLLEIVNFLTIHSEVRAIPFQTYIKGDKLSSDHVHSFKSFTKEELEQESKKWTFKWATVSVEERLEKLDDNLKEVFRECGKRICCIADNIKEVHPKSGYTTYQISKLKNFCAIKFPKGYLEVHLKVNKDIFNDPKKVTHDIKRTPNWTFDKVFAIKSKEEIDYAVALIKQSYLSISKSNKQ
ncbi:MAG TPA: DUF5655 domain-containing protein [Ignavibacteria bacterium]|nr:DUF5655 domain-containing protein [Ignavibacteria bacterium]